jgi:hypothetical protein
MQPRWWYLSDHSLAIGMMEKKTIINVFDSSINIIIRAELDSPEDTIDTFGMAFANLC